MGEARAEIAIGKPADDVWAVIGDFGALTWMPGVESCELEGDDRIIYAFDMRVVERLHARDEEARTLAYGLVDGDMKLETHRATITVMPAGIGSFVTWDVDTGDAMVGVIARSYARALAALKEQLEA
jgi:hypothetical protein